MEIAVFLNRLEQEPPPLERIDPVATRMFAGVLPDGFRIVAEIHFGLGKFLRATRNR